MVTFVILSMFVTSDYILNREVLYEGMVTFVSLITFVTSDCILYREVLYEGMVTFVFLGTFVTSCYIIYREVLYEGMGQHHVLAPHPRGRAEDRALSQSHHQHRHL